MQHKRVGRPRTIDPAEVSLIAVRLFDSRGYDAVSVSEVAQAAGVSRRYLFSLFPTKASLVWGGLDETGQRFRGALAASSGSVSTEEAVRAAYLSAVDFRQDEIELTRRRLLVIDSHPALASEGATSLAQLTDVVGEFIAVRENRDPDELRVRVIATTIAAAARAALTWWAIHSDEQPKEVVSRALDLVMTPTRTTR